MKIDTPEISWHSRQPMYSLDIQPGKSEVKRLATGSTDANVRIWSLKMGKDGKVSPEFLATLSRHTKPVNVVRFSPDGQILASGADDGLCILWRLQDATSGVPSFGKEEEAEDDKETWSAFKTLRGHFEDIYDISWSADSSRMVTGSVDNSAIIWDVKKGDKVHLFKDHRSFVQGVAWDPLNHFCATISCDRSMRVYSLQNFRCVYNVSRFTLKVNDNNGETQKKQIRMFHDDSMKSFFRRLTYTPDGQLLIVPSGCIETGDSVANTTFVFSRLSYSKPILHLPGPSKATAAVRCCPILFKLRKSSPQESESEEMDTSEPSEKTDVGKEEVGKEEEEKVAAQTPGKPTEEETEPNLFDLPYRMVFAVATEDSILFYDTQQSIPFAYVSNIHYTTISDISWSSDGSWLAVCSTDGYVTIISFEPNEIGEIYEPPKVVAKSQVQEETPVEEVKPQEEPTNCITPKEDGVLPEEISVKPVGSKSEDKEGTKEKLKAALKKDYLEQMNGEDNKAPRRITTTHISSEREVPVPVAKENVGAPNKDKIPPKIHSVNGSAPRRIMTTLLSSSAVNSTVTGTPVVLHSNVQKPPSDAKKQGDSFASVERPALDD
ncbi:putative chromatin assembly factor 1 subunit B-like [Apostichopus japonicus]|uniref:Putative chromatin assembly factor 1 subunit B-like n=1 Tax=Stichopus japonicus TaxID=307972 RepID=A0A2G8K742_STIJA|nr:putative chromatin assembly factor 1 subunit B-like [Apostichopus japonicus]